MSDASSKLPPYSVRVSAKARNIRLKVTVRDGLEVIVPKDYDQDRIPNLLQKKFGWIQAAERRMSEQQKFFIPEPPGDLPTHIVLRALGEDWSVTYRKTKSARIIVTEQDPSRLLVSGNVEDEEGCENALRRWLARKTRTQLAPRLRDFAQNNGFVIRNVTVRGQKTRWASCSKKSTISINYKLLFIHWNLVRYVFLHELCHTRQMNHSRKFWLDLECREPDYRRLDDELRKAWRYVPIWTSNH